MKASNYKSLIIATAILIVSGLTAQSVFAQRGGRGGGSSAGRGSASRGSMSRGGGSFGGGNRSAAIRNQNFGSGRSSFGRGTIGAGSVGRGAIGRGNIGRGSFGRGNIVRSGFGRSYGRRGYGRPGYRAGAGFGYRRPYYGYGYRNYYRPYLGFSLSILPFGYYPFYYGADQFYYSGGLFYRQYDNEYKVVVPPVGAEVPDLPKEANEVVINGETYYEYKGVYYSVSQNADGKTVYIVAGKDGVLNTDGNADTAPQAGEIVNELPEGSREVFLKGEKYYVSPDDIYYEEVVDGKSITYRVVGQ